MAVNKPINEFTNQVTSVPNGSFYGLDKWDGISFSTVKILHEDLQEALSKHFLNANLTSTGNRSHDFDENDMLFGKIKTFRAEATTAPTASFASFNHKGYGTGSGDITHRNSSQLGASQEWYGDLNTRFFGKIGVGMAPNPFYSIETSGGVKFNGTSMLFGDGSDAILLFNGSGFSRMRVDPTLGAFAFLSEFANGHHFGDISNGVMLSHKKTGSNFNTMLNAPSSFNESNRNPNAMIQLESTNQGFQGARMTESQKDAISVTVADYGLEIYQTDGVEGKYIYKSIGWTFIG